VAASQSGYKMERRKIDQGLAARSGRIVRNDHQGHY